MGLLDIEIRVNIKNYHRKNIDALIRIIRLIANLLTVE